MTQISADDSIGIIETHGFISSAKLAQVIGSETRARIAAISVPNGAGVVTTVLAGTVADVQYAIQTAKSQNLATDAMFIARPNKEVLNLLHATIGNVSQSAPKSEKREETLSLFSGSSGGPPASTKPVKKVERMNPNLGQPRTPAFEPKVMYEIQEMNVHELRKYARSIPAFAITGREISRGTRLELLQMIKSHNEAAETQAAHETMIGLRGTLPS